MMNARTVRALLIFLLIVLFIFFAKMEVFNAVFSLGVGVWVMMKSFNLLFGPAQEFGKLPLDIFIPDKWMILDLLDPPTRKPTFFVLIWWTAGILATIVTYKLLTALLIKT
jgi:hypothetical protein